MTTDDRLAKLRGQLEREVRRQLFSRGTDVPALRARQLQLALDALEQACPPFPHGEHCYFCERMRSILNLEDNERR